MTAPRLQYSVLTPVGSSGNGLIARIEVAAALRRGVLQRVFSSGSSLPDLPLTRVPWIRVPVAGRWPLGKRLNWTLAAMAFDWVVSRSLEAGDVFHGWAYQVLATLERARALGVRTVVERGSCAAPELASLLDAEYDALGFRDRHFLAAPEVVRRSMAEYEAADVLLSPSTVVTASLARIGLGAKVSTVPLGVDTARFTPARAGERRTPFTVLFVGTLEPRKGVHHLVAAAARLASLPIQLHLIGSAEPRYLAHLRKQGVDFQHTDALPHEELCRSYATAGVCVVPSIEDGFAMVATEAMASGTTVIVTDRVGAKDFVLNGVNGWIVPPGVPAALAEHIETLVREPERAQVMGEAARHCMESNTWERYTERLAAVYAAAVERRTLTFDAGNVRRP